MAPSKFTKKGVLSCALVLAAAGCGGGGGGGGGGGQQTSGARLERITYGRLVDVYAYRRVGAAGADRRDELHREPVLIAKNVVVSPIIETDPLIDAVGEVRPGANFRFLPFDVSVGHEELMILWDDVQERAQFDAALSIARSGVVELSPAYRDQNVLTNPIPVVPRNAALELKFDRSLGLTTEFFQNNPSAIQLLRFRDDPNVVPAPVAFEPATVRVLTDGGDSVVIDTTLIGGETSLSRTTNGLQQSLDQLTANYRIAIPTQGIAATLFKIRPDVVPQLNGVDAIGDPATIRDFRSGNLLDGRVGALDDFERPQLITQKRMGITAIDTSTRTLTVTKRGSHVAVRGRLPFVDGLISRDSGLPKGPSEVPTVDENGTAFPLRAGDFLVQNVTSLNTGELVRIRAEIMQVLEVGTVEGDGNFTGPGLTATGTDGGDLDVFNVVVSTLRGFDSAGNEVQLEAAANNGAGADCDVTVRYYEYLRYGPAMGSGAVSDADRRVEFALIDPDPVSLPATPQGAIVILPDASIGFRFSEPVDVEAVSTFDNFLLSQQECHVGNFPAVLATPKSASLDFLVARLIDRRGDGTLLELQPPAGFHHVAGQTERYWLHIDLGTSGVRDLAGNRLDIVDRRQPDTITSYGQSVDVPLANFSMPFDISATALDSWIGNRVFRFAAGDEDGTRPGSLDYFGQFQLDNGTLRAAPVTRRSKTADSANLASIQRWQSGQCVAPAVAATPGPPPTPRIPPTNIQPRAALGGGVLYQTPSMVAVQPAPPLVFQPPQGPQPFGGIVEPHTAFGCRMQMTYREDDFGLSYHDTSDLNIDVEQMNWAPWNDAVVLFDRFDRYTMALGHSNKRPDYLFRRFDPPMGPSTCELNCTSLFSGISPVFADNPLQGSSMVEVVKDQSYVINPNDAFRAASGIKYVPYPKFSHTYTWRDSRHVSWDMALDRAIGLGGAQDPVDPPPVGDSTTDISSPWCQDNVATAMLGINNDRDGWVHDRLVRDFGDFNGLRQRDHDPIALPLLVDISVWPDDTRAVANAGNLFHIAYLGPIWTPAGPGGYYNQGPGVTTPNPWQCTNIDWPFFRVYSFGGPDPNNPSTFTRVDPDRELTARGGVIKDLGLGDPIAGLAQTKAGDSTLHWSQIDLVRKVSMVTFGFFDTLRPNAHDLLTQTPALPGLPPVTGRPDLLATPAGPDIRLQDMVAVLDPPPARQPGGTSIAVEFRGLKTMTNATLYNPLTQDRPDHRGNLLNANYACEAYRYAMVNPGDAPIDPPVTPADPFPTGARVPAEGLTPYVTETDLDLIRDPANNLLPRFMNFRLIMENNVSATPPQSPALRGVGLVFRAVRSS
ncbi:MAG: hypothetical protein U1F36_04185 [Planctomycetota bacterium]